MKQDLLIVCSESINYYQNRSYPKQHEKIKTLITEGIIDEQENVSNFIILSNNMTSVRINKEDRRFVVTRCVETNSPEYYHNLYQVIQNPIFYSHLLSYFLSTNLSNWNRFPIPETMAKSDIINDVKFKNININNKFWRNKELKIERKKCKLLNFSF